MRVFTPFIKKYVSYHAAVIQSSCDIFGLFALSALLQFFFKFVRRIGADEMIEICDAVYLIQSVTHEKCIAIEYLGIFFSGTA